MGIIFPTVISELTRSNMLKKYSFASFDFGLYLRLNEHPCGYTNIYIRGAYDKFPDFFHMGTFIDSKHMKLSSPSK